MNKLGMDIFRKNFWLIGTGVALQLLSGIFFFAGALRVLRDVSAAAREAIVKSLTEEE